MLKKVYGVEIVANAIEDAKINAQKNHINNARFVVGKAEEQMARWQENGLKPDVIMVDPPRKGLDESFIESAAKMAPQKNRLYFLQSSHFSSRCTNSF